MLLEDFQDSFGGPRVARFPDWATDYLPADLDLAGHELLNFDFDSIGFGPIAAHYIFAGPVSGLPAAPTFRPFTPGEIDAQPHADALDSWAGVDPSLIGLNLATLNTPLSDSYLKASHLGIVQMKTPSQVGDEIAAFIHSVNGVMFDTATPDTYTLTINGNLNTQGDVAFLGNFATGPGNIVVNTLEDDVNVYIRSGTLQIVNPDFGWGAWTGTASKASRDVTTVTLPQLAAAVKGIMLALLNQDILSVGAGI